MDPMKKRKLEENGVVTTELLIEDAKTILEPFTQEQLFEIAQNAVVRHPDVLDAVRLIADADITKRKLFIRGLGWDTTNEKLQALFLQYGELDEAVVILDKATGKSKGYGFITFKHIDGALRALKQPSKQIDGRMTVTQLAATGVSAGGGPTVGGPIGGVTGGVGVGNRNNQGEVSLRKIYVANVPSDMTGERLLHHFEMYGEIEEGPLGFDKSTGKSKGFALFVYRTPEGARASLFDPIKNIDGHQLNCKLADTKKGKPGVQGGVIGQGNGINSVIPVGGQYGGGPTGVVGMSNYGGNGGVGSGPYGGGVSHFGGPGLTGYGGLGGAGGGLGVSGGGFGGPGSGLGGASGGLGGAGAGFGGSGGGLGSAGSGFGGPGGGFGGRLGGASGGGGGGGALSGGGVGEGGRGGGSSIYGGSREYPLQSALQSAHYSLSSSTYQNQNQNYQATVASPTVRVPPGGLYPPRY